MPGIKWRFTTDISRWPNQALKMSAGGQFSGKTRPLLKEILFSCVVVVMKTEVELNFWSDSLSLPNEVKIYVGQKSVFYSL